MATVNLDFTNIEAQKRMSAGTHKVTISSAEIKTASSGNSMLAVAFKDETGAVAYDNFVLLNQSLWKLKMFLEAVFNQPFTGRTQLDPRNLIGRQLVITCVDEEYINNDGNPAVRSAVQNDFAPVSLQGMVGVGPTVVQAPVNPVPQPQPIITPQVENAPVGSPVPPQQPAPQPQPIPQSTPQPEPSVAPTPTPTPSRPKLPWEN